MEEEKIKLAFLKVKYDILFLESEISYLRKDLKEIKTLVKTLYKDLIAEKQHEIAGKQSPFLQNSISTLQNKISTDPAISTDNSTVPYEVKGLKTPNLGISTGNEGVSTDRQTDTSTDISTHNLIKDYQKHHLNSKKESIESNILKATKILDSLDNLKKEIRLKFKKITPQEMVVFSSIYQLEEQEPQDATYKRIASNLKLSESSIRDYVQRMIDKGIPIKKQKINNKKIILSVSQELRKIATLSTIIQLREL